jgi:hypothetical protein
MFSEQITLLGIAPKTSLFRTQHKEPCGAVPLTIPLYPPHDGHTMRQTEV